MSNNLAYMSAPGALPKILNKICEASTPESFNHDFLGTRLGFPGGNQRTFISWAKKSGFLTSDGTPTQIYKNFRNPASRGSAMAKALKIGYKELYTRNEYAHDLVKKDIIKLVSEITGNPHDNSTVKNISSSFFHAKVFANFDIKSPVKAETKASEEPRVIVGEKKIIPNKLNLGLNYTINLVLPKTDDAAIYDAIFTSLRENLLDE